MRAPLDLSAVLSALDALVVAGALWLLVRLLGHAWEPRFTAAAALAVALYFAMARRQRLYRSWRVGGLAQELGQVLIVWGCMAGGLLAIAYGSKMSDSFSRAVVALWFASGLALLVASRIAVRILARAVRARGGNLRRTAIAGAGPLGREVAASILAAPWMGLRLEGFYDDRLAEADVAGSLDELVEHAREARIDVVYLTLPMREEERMGELVRRLAATRASVYLVPDVLGVSLLRSRWFTLGRFPTVSLLDAPSAGVEALVKRAEDLLLGSLILAAVALPMLAVAAAVKLASRGPVLFKQRRYGLDGREIVVWKFRTMGVAEADARFRQATRDDPRVNRLGRFLRSTSLDELPQFINVLQGSMSIVGPRPHPLPLDHQHRDQIEGYGLRHRVKPGITGWAQVHGFRGETDTLEKMERRIEHDLHYIRNWSVALDLKIVALTVRRGFTGGDVY